MVTKAVVVKRSCCKQLKAESLLKLACTGTADTGAQDADE